MTREEAVSRIQQALNVPNRLQGLVLIDEESANMAIEALQKDIERYERVIRASERYLGIVRCKDCRWWGGTQHTKHNNHLCKRAIDQNVEYWTKADDYCSYGERREGDTE